MTHRWKAVVATALLTALLFTGCAMPTMDDLYCLPKRSEAYNNLQMVIEEEMEFLSYSAPISGENQQTVQSADLDGDGVEEYLLFARDDSEKKLKILIFSQLATGYVLMDTIESYGLAFEFVDYAQLDDRPGVEIVVGCQLSDSVARSVSVYRFTSGFARQLMNGSYSRMVSADFDGDGVEELLLISPGQTNESNAVAVLYTYGDNEMNRSAEIGVSAPAASLKRTTLGKLQDGEIAWFVSAGTEDNGILTDIITVSGGQICMAFKGIQTEALSNYFLYAEDVDNDGVTELPQLFDMKPISGSSTGKQKLVQWYTLDSSGQRTDKMWAYYNYSDGWYLRLKEEWADGFSVSRSEEELNVYLRTSDGEAQKVFTICRLTGLNKEEQLAQKKLIQLYKGESVIYAAKLTSNAEKFHISEDTLKNCFALIRADWNAEEKGENKE